MMQLPLWITDFHYNARISTEQHRNIESGLLKGTCVCIESESDEEDLFTISCLGILSLVKEM